MKRSGDLDEHTNFGQRSVLTPCAPPSTPLRSAQDVASRNGKGDVALILPNVKPKISPIHKDNLLSGAARKRCVVEGRG